MREEIRKEKERGRREGIKKEREGEWEGRRKKEFIMSDIRVGSNLWFFF